MSLDLTTTHVSLGYYYLQLQLETMHVVPQAVLGLHGAIFSISKRDMNKPQNLHDCKLRIKPLWLVLQQSQELRGVAKQQQIGILHQPLRGNVVEVGKSGEMYTICLTSFQPPWMMSHGVCLTGVLPSMIGQCRREQFS